MKTVKFLLIAAVFSCAMINLASGDGFTQKKQVVKITLDRAIYNYSLGQAIYTQVNDEFLAKEKPVYVCRVLHQGKIYLVTGTANQWMDFFDQWGASFKKMWTFRVRTTAHGPEIR
jgi:hypothetical protein